MELAEGEHVGDCCGCYCGCCCSCCCDQMGIAGRAAAVLLETDLPFPPCTHTGGRARVQAPSGATPGQGGPPCRAARRPGRPLVQNPHGSGAGSGGRGGVGLARCMAGAGGGTSGRGGGARGPALGWVVHALGWVAHALGWVVHALTAAPHWLGWPAACAATSPHWCLAVHTGIHLYMPALVNTCTVYVRSPLQCTARCGVWPCWSLTWMKSTSLQ